MTWVATQLYDHISPLCLQDVSHSTDFLKVLWLWVSCYNMTPPVLAAIRLDSDTSNIYK